MHQAHCHIALLAAGRDIMVCGGSLTMAREYSDIPERLCPRPPGGDASIPQPPSGTLGTMGFALYLDTELAWCQGTHEYRPMGVAVVGAGSVFSPRDFHPRRALPHAGRTALTGFFASLGEVNGYLAKRRSPAFRKKRKKTIPSSLPIL
jgi:hypothetical protein